MRTCSYHHDSTVSGEGGGTQGQQGEILYKESKTDNQNHAVRDPDPTLFKQEKTGHILFSKFII